MNETTIFNLDTNTPTTGANRSIALWLFTCCALVFAMVVLGGVTRLTGSGLSMVDWQPVTGILPPLNETEWRQVFDQYQQSPEFQKINYGMDLDGFKGIFWLEYLHRVLGRLIGLVFLLPFLFFWLARKIPPGFTPKFITMFILGGLQGLLGWYMVKSGLIDNPHVSQYRLTAHLLLAVLIYGYMLWVALGLFSATGERTDAAGLRAGAYILIAFTVLVMASGGFVAGLKAGMIYNTFPLMGEHWIPNGLFNMEPWFRNLFDNPTTVQFNHRLLAIAVFVYVVLYWLTARRQALSAATRTTVDALLVVAIAQVALGISTLLLQVPITLAAIHQAGALVLFTVAVVLARRLGAVRSR